MQPGSMVKRRWVQQHTGQREIVRQSQICLARQARCAKPKRIGISPRENIGRIWSSVLRQASDKEQQQARKKLQRAIIRSFAAASAAAASAAAGPKLMERTSKAPGASDGTSGAPLEFRVRVDFPGGRSAFEVVRVDASCAVQALLDIVAARRDGDGRELQ